MRILLRSCQKVWRISKADRYFESCSLWAPIFRGPCDQVALLNALKELEWLTPFDEWSRATSSARTWKGAGAYGTRIRMQLYLEGYCACRRHQGCHCMKRRLRYVADFWAALGQAAACKYLVMWGVGRKEQWRIKKLRADLIR